MPSVGVLAWWLFGWPVTPLGISALGGLRAVRSAAVSGASFCCRASPVASNSGSSRCGWAGGTGGVAALSFIGVTVWVWPSGTGAGPRPGSHVAFQCPRPATPLRRGGLCCRCPALWMRDPCRELVASRVCPRGVSRDGGERQVRVRVRAGCRVTARWCPRGPYCRSGWWVVALLGCRFGLCRGRRMVPWGRRAGCRWSLWTGAPGGDVGVGAHDAEGLLGLGAGGVGWGSGTCLCVYCACT